jgi:hypothetical protein
VSRGLSKPATLQQQLLTAEPLPEALTYAAEQVVRVWGVASTPACQSRSPRCSVPKPESCYLLHHVSDQLWCVRHDKDAASRLAQTSLSRPNASTRDEHRASHGSVSSNTTSPSRP